MRFILFISLPFYVLDQATKWWVQHNINPDDMRPPVISGFFYLVNVTNSGAAFGSFKNNNTSFVILSCVALVIVVIFLLRQRTSDLLRDVSLALLLAGIMGNLTDRLLHGHVIDFLLFDLHMWWAHPWPAFNVADSCICIAVMCFIIHSFKKPRVTSETSRVQ